MAGLKRITDLPAAATLIGDELVEVSQVSSVTTLSASTIAAAASDNSFNDASSGFVSAGFAVGDRVRVTGFATSANNLLVGVVTAVSAAKMVIGGADGDVIANEAAGAAVTISKWTSRRALLSEIGIGGGGGSGAYDLRFGFVDTPTSDQVLDTVMIGRDIELPADLADSVGRVGVNPTSSFVMSLKDDGTTIATITVGTGGAFTFATTGGVAQTILAGSVLTLQAPSSADATVESMSMTILGSEA